MKLETILLSTLIGITIASAIVLYLAKPTWVSKINSSGNEELSVSRLIVFSLLFGTTLATFVLLVMIKK